MQDSNYPRPSKPAENSRWGRPAYGTATKVTMLVVLGLVLMQFWPPWLFQVIFSPAGFIIPAVPAFFLQLPVRNIFMKLVAFVLGYVAVFAICYIVYVFAVLVGTGGS